MLNLTLRVRVLDLLFNVVHIVSVRAKGQGQDLRLRVFALLFCAPLASAQEAVPLVEDFSAGHHYRVEAAVRISGQLALPQPKNQPARIVDITGVSKLAYHERLLKAEDNAAQKTIRIYREVDFRRQIGTAAQEAGIRPSVRRMIVLRNGGKKAPFSPDGPLTWDEIDVVRTDVFNPSAIPGLLPPNPARPGQRWRMTAAAIAELTDMEKVEDGDLTVHFEALVTLENGKRAARLAISGKITGVNEDGPNRQEIEGKAYFDLEARFLSYLSIHGTKELLDGQKQVVGRVKGHFAMTRSLSPLPADLTDASLRDLDLKPTFENSLLLYDNPDLGVRFLYPRGWRVGAVQGRQVTVEQPRAGGGILITVEPAAKLPTAEDYLREIDGFLKKEKAKDPRLVERVARVRAEPSLDRFALEAELGGDKVRLEYAVLKQVNGGATLAARLPAATAAPLRPEVERILRSLAITRTIAEK